MNQLDFPIRILELDVDDICILVSHDDVRSTDAKARQRANHTRSFTNWVRKQFPHIPTEFRFVNSKQVKIHNRYSRHGYSRTAGCDKHFIAYGLKRNELMLIKLAWSFTTQRVRLATMPGAQSTDFTITAPQGFRPSDALKARMAKKTKAKMLSTDT